MNLTPFANGRLQAAVLAAMNVRAVVSPYEVTYVARPIRELALVSQAVGPRFQPRDEFGRFAPYADLHDAMNRGYAWTALECDYEDEAGDQDEALTAEGEALADDWDQPRAIGNDAAGDDEL